MDYEEAQQLLDSPAAGLKRVAGLRRVAALTQSNGFYVGVLTGAIPKKRGWRAQVKIDGVLTAAIHYDAQKGVTRRGHRTGETVEFPGSKVQLTTEQGTSYLEALETAIRLVGHWLKNNSNSKHAESQRQLLNAYQEALQSEHRRVETGVWQLPQPQQLPQPARLESTQLPLQGSRVGQ